MQMKIQVFESFDGIAIEDNGCVLGIPTYIEADASGSIGRILDLGSLFANGMLQ